MMDKTEVKKILVTGVGGPTPRSFVRAIKFFGGEHKDSFEFVGVDSNRYAYGLYDKSLFSTTFLVPHANDDKYWEVINSIVDKNGIDAAIVLPEVEVLEWSKNHSRLNKKIKLHLPDYMLASDLVNKFKVHELLKASGYVPGFLRVNPLSYSFASLQEKFGNEFWIRGTEGSSGLGALKIDSAETLEQWISMNPKITEFVATEYLPGRNLACKLLYFDNKLVATACAERVRYIMAKVSPSGITGNTSFGRLLNEPGLVDLSVDTLNILSKQKGADLNGIFTIDFKEDASGTPKITEINIRHVAFTSSIAAGGANLPLLTLINLFTNEKDRDYQTIHFTFDEPYIFLRDVDSLPILMKESDLY